MSTTIRLALAGLAASSLAVLVQAPADAGGTTLPHPAHGSDAIALLDSDLGAAAAANGQTPAELRRILTQDPTAWLDRDARMYYVEPTDGGTRSLAQDVAPFPLDQTFLLHSRPTSTHVIYLDFDGTTVSGTAWNPPNGGLANGFYSGYSLDGDFSTFNDTEKEQVQSVWQRVAEDYAAFDVDVTTQDPGDAAIDRTGSGDQSFGTRAAISDNSTVSSAVCPTGCGGVAYVGVFDDFGTGTSAHAYHQPAWVFGHLLANNDTKDIAEAAAHEVGHNFGLSHDGTTATTSGCSNLSYYCGHAMWAPIMGVGYQKPVVQWSKGEYTNANNTQNDLSIIAAGGAPVIADEAGGTVATAAAGLPSRAYITSASDSDTFALGTCAGTMTVSAAGAPPSPDLDLQLELLGAGGTAISTADPTSALGSRDSATGLDASITTGVASGAYYVRVDGVGNGTGATGYTDYASIGAYTLTVSGCNAQAPPAAPTSLAVTTSPAGTSATVTWAAPVSDGGSAVTGYVASRSGTAPASLSATTFTQTWSGLTPGASYLFSVQATNAVGTGVATSQSVTMPAAPGQPTSIVVTPAADGRSAEVAWSAPASDGGSAVIGFHLTRTGAPPVDVGLQGTYTWSDLTPGTNYTFGVAAINAVGTGPAATQSATTPTVPGAPTGLSAASAPDGHSVTLTWSAPASDGGSGLAGYRVALDGGEPVDPGSDRVHVWTGLTPGTTYQFSVVARNAVGDGEAATTSATTFTAPGAPAAPSAKKGKKGGARTATVSWTAPSATGGQPVTGYRVLAYRIRDGRTGRAITSAVLTGTSYRFKGRAGKYRFAVVALSPAGASPPSALSKQTKVQ